MTTKHIRLRRQSSAPPGVATGRTLERGLGPPDKHAAGRPQDLADVAKLERAREKQRAR
jgi:hypothetical protein